MTKPKTIETGRPVLDQLKERRAEIRADLDALLAAPGARGDQNLRASEQRRFDDARKDLDALNDRISELEAQRAAQDVAGAAAVFVGQSGGSRISIGHEERTYRGPDGPSYFADLAAARIAGDTGADERLRRHEQEVDTLERRDLSRTDGAGGYFVPPSWLVDQWVEKPRAGRVVADLCTKLPLPPGTDSLNIPKISTGTSTAIQTADNATVSETDLADDVINMPVRTIAGQQDIALQVLEQSPGAFDQVVFADLMADHDQKLDAQVIAGTGTSGQVVGILATSGIDTTTYTDGSPTVPELYPKIADSINVVDTSRYMSPECIIMAPRRWNWITAQLDSSNRPLVVPAAAGPYLSPATMGERTAQGLVGTMLGLPVFIDPNVPLTRVNGTEDVIIVTRPSDHLLFESGVRTRVLPEVGSGTLTVRLQLYSYVAFTAARFPSSTSLVEGTGTTVPAF